MGKLRRCLVVSLTGSLALLPQRTLAQPVMHAPDLEVVGRDDPEDGAGPPDAPASSFANRVSLERAQAEGRSVAEVLETLPSLHVRRLGGLGAYATLSIRGSTASQVTVLIDGIPIAPSSDRSLSLDDLSADAFEAIDVYRGVAPLALDGGFAIGGVVDLRSAPTGAPSSAAATAGSFGTYRLAVSAPARVGRVRMRARASVLETDGDFDFYDDRGTRQNPDDDAIVARKNADFTLVDAGARATARLAGGSRLEVSLAATAREGGVPGLGTFQAEHARTRALRTLAAVAFERQLGGLGTATLRLAARADATALSDRDNEVGLGPQDRSDHTTYAELSVPIVLAVLGGIVELSPLLSVEGTAARDPVAVVPEPGAIVRQRAGFGAAAERAFGALSMRAAASVAAVADGHELSSTSLGSVARPASPPLRLEPAAGLGARVDPAPWLTLRANATTSVRSPTFEELVGNSGSVQGNATLSPERAIGGDVGATIAVDRARAMAAVYWQEVADLVQFVQTSQRTARATNIGRARLRGLEVSASVRPWDWLRGRVSLGALDAENLSSIPSQHGKRVPGRPAFDLSAAVDAQAGPVGLGADVDVAAGNALDPANLQEAPARAFVGTVATVTPVAGVTLALSIRNVLDHKVADVALHPPPLGGRREVPEAVSDYGGFPLPGRTVLLTLRWTQRTEEERP